MLQKMFKGEAIKLFKRKKTDGQSCDVAKSTTITHLAYHLIRRDSSNCLKEDFLAFSHYHCVLKADKITRFLLWLTHYLWNSEEFFYFFFLSFSFEYETQRTKERERAKRTKNHNL